MCNAGYAFIPHYEHQIFIQDKENNRIPTQIFSQDSGDMINCNSLLAVVEAYSRREPDANRAGAVLDRLID